MTGQERSTAIAIALSLLVNSVVIFRVAQLFSSGALDGSDGPMTWARTVLWSVPALLVLTAVSHILLRVLSRDRESDAVVDERDRLFQLRGVALTTFVFGIGFVAAIAGLAWGWPAVTALNAIYLSCVVGDLTGNTLRFLCYRCGG